MDVTIDAIGAQGDGIARTPEGRLYVPFAAPGDRLRVEPGATRGDGRAATISEILEPGPGRCDPVCRHFGDCGGCSLQHLRPDAIAAAKARLLDQALARRRLSPPTPIRTIGVPPGTRRRVRLAYRRGMRGIVGFNRRQSRMVLNVTECPVILPEIAELIAPLRALCHGIQSLGKSADIQVTRLDNGIDLLLIPDRPSEPDLDAREALARFAEDHDLARLSWMTDGFCEPIAVRRRPQIRFGDAVVHPPADAFLQPSVGGEHAIVETMLEAFDGQMPDRILDLYAGCGALTFPLSKLASVVAVEGDEAMTEALRSAAGDKPVTVERRDLWRDPPSPSELQPFGAVVFDPPRAGARPVAEALAGSEVPTVVAVSCNPATLARDLRILVDGGYALEDCTAIDQFPWSSHVEAVAILRR